MKFYVGKWYFLVRLLSNDLCFGVGRPSESLKDMADRSRMYRNV